MSTKSLAAAVLATALTGGAAFAHALPAQADPDDQTVISGSVRSQYGDNVLFLRLANGKTVKVDDTRALQGNPPRIFHHEWASFQGNYAPNGTFYATRIVSAGNTSYGAAPDNDAAITPINDPDDLGVQKLTGTIRSGIGTNTLWVAANTGRNVRVDDTEALRRPGLPQLDQNQPVTFQGKWTSDGTFHAWHVLRANGRYYGAPTQDSDRR